MAINDNAVQDFIKSIKTEEIDTNSTYSAVVSRVDEEGTVWVYLAGSDIETPTASTSTEVDTGDAVNVEWRNNKLYIAGNFSNPAAGTTRVANVEAAARIANEAAANAVVDAGRAREAAESAVTDAATAKTAADTSIANLSYVQDVLDVVNWVAEHGVYVKASSYVEGTKYYTVEATEVTDPTQQTDELVYRYYELVNGVYVKTEDTEYDSSKTYYNVTGTPVSQPKSSDIGSYYILNVTDAMGDYIQSHLVLTNDGLYVMADDTDWKVLIGPNGVKIIDGTGVVDKVVADYSDEITIGEKTSSNTKIDSTGFSIRDGLIKLAEFTQSIIKLGMNAVTAVIELCGGAGKITATRTPEGSLYRDTVLTFGAIEPDPNHSSTSTLKIYAKRGATSQQSDAPAISLVDDDPAGTYGRTVTINAGDARILVAGDRKEVNAGILGYSGISLKNWETYLYGPSVRISHDTGGNFSLYEDGNASIHVDFDGTNGLQQYNGLYKQILADGKPNAETGYEAKNENTNVACYFGVGAAGTNHGVYSRKQARWLINGDANDIYIGGVKQAPTLLTTTYATNSYVNSTSFGRISARKVGHLIIIDGNLQITSAMPTSTDFIKIGSIGGMGTVVQAARQQVPCSSGGSIAVNINTNGDIEIYNYAGTISANAWARFNCTLVASD